MSGELTIYEKPRIQLTRVQIDTIHEDIDMFVYDPFGHGSLLEQAVDYIVNKKLIGSRIDMAFVSKASRLLNEIIEREMILMRIVIEEKFLFETMNEFGRGGYMRVHDTTGKEYLRWSI